MKSQLKEEYVIENIVVGQTNIEECFECVFIFIFFIVNLFISRPFIKTKVSS